VVAFDRLLADLKDGTPIGHFTNQDGTSEVLKWEGSVKLGESSFEQRFYEILNNAGFRTPVIQGARLFSGSTNDRQQLPRYLVGARILDYAVELHYDKAKHFGAGPVVGRTRLRLEWQVLDKATGNLALTVTTEGISRNRQLSGSGTSENLLAFEDALIAFLDRGELLRLVKETTVLPAGAAHTSTTTLEEIGITRPLVPAFATLSEVIKYADKSCFTVITDGGHGSGIIINTEGYVLSAHHVVNGVNRIEVQFSDGLRQSAHVVRPDAANDVVLLDIDGSGFRPLLLGQGDDDSLGDEVITIGTPAEVELGQSVAKGILSGKRKFDDQVYLQTDMAVSPGNSGGPLINAKGEVIGIVQRKLVGEGVEGIGFAIPIERAVEVLRLKLKD